MRISKKGLLTAGIVFLASMCLFVFINGNHKKITQNSIQKQTIRQNIKSIDATVYKINELQLNTQRFIITGDPLFEKEALGKIKDLNQMAQKFDSEKSYRPEYLFTPLLYKKLNLEQKLLSASKVSNKDAVEILSNQENKDITTFLYQSLSTLKENYLQQINVLNEEVKAIDILNFKISIAIILGSIVLILLTLFNIFKNKRLRKVAETDSREIEIKYKNLVENCGAGLLTTDLNGNITFINKRITSFTGFEPNEIVGKNYSSLVDPEWVNIINEKFKKQFLVRKSECCLEFPLRVKSGNIIWVEQTSVILSEEGEPKGFQCLVKEITDKKKVEEELKKIEQQREEYQFRLQSILDNTPLIVFIKDLEGKYLLANKSYRDAFNLTREQIIGKTDLDLVPEENAKRYKEIDEYVIREQKNTEVEETVQIDNVTTNLLIVKFPLFDKDNNIYGIGGIATDITERYLYGMHLIESKSKAEMAEQLQEEFLANMSHEIRTPMNGIIGMTNILLNTSMTDEQKDFLKVIKKSSDNLLVLINDILDLSKIKAGKLRIEKIDFRLRETLEHSINTFRCLIKEKGLTLRISVDLDVPDSLTGDPHRLNQILNNLISNSIKFTVKGEINLEIKAIQQENKEVNLLFCVADTGIGIAKEKLKTIFETFSQAETETSRKFGGSGLGLSITKKLIELQNGSIDVSSTPGEGTTFTFNIKYAIANNTVAKQYGNVKQDTLKQDGLSGKRILIVEDNEANQKVIYHMLHNAGIEPDLADNGKVAIQLLEDSFEYDLIIMDLQMPEMDGFETTVYIRQKLNLSIPIIAMTASALRNEKIKCLEIGMNEYMNKPFVPSDLFRELRRFLLKSEETEIEETPIIPKNESKKLYSLNHLIEMDDMDCLCEVLQLFLDSVPMTMIEIKEAIIEERWEDVYKKSHKVKSSIGILQMGKLMSLISKVELDAKERKNLDEILSNFEKAEELFEKINPMIEVELASALAVVQKN
ncbi:MAG: PAS domain S-box protein [Ginsengibacter sp.]